MSTIKCKEITPELWGAFEKLFGDNGACGGCWCQHWRVPSGKEFWEDFKGAKAKMTTKKLITSGEMTGLLAFDGDKPVGWCSYGPRDVYTRINQMKPYARDDTAGVWSINCFFIDKHYRHQGVATQMLAAAVKFIRKHKVKIIEGYPTPLTKAGDKLPAAFVYAGPLKMFEDAGFEIIQRHSHTRPLVRKIV
ncbi:MAG: GNAT family N-acetyltransferase [Candidatus Zixiibacteriota bacterium]